MYSAAHMHRICMAGLRQCCSSFSGHAPEEVADAYFGHAIVQPAVARGIGVLISSLLRMSPAKAARRLASVWHILLQGSRAGPGMHPKQLGLHIGQLLGELLPHLQQQEHGQGRLRSGLVGGSCGGLQSAVQADKEVAAGGAGGGSGEGAVAQGKHCVPAVIVSDRYIPSVPSVLVVVHRGDPPWSYNCCCLAICEGIPRMYTYRTSARPPFGYAQMPYGTCKTVHRRM